MKKAQVVIGANFGDEAKGLVTDYLSAKTGPETLIVRFNGGAQAGHTVTAPDGRRHIFGHTGSGGFVGCPTFLSRFFVCNPLTFLREEEQLRKIGVRPEVYIDQNAPVTTPYDMMINQCIEEIRGTNRHGSCGVGFGETIERNLRPDFALIFGDLGNEDLLRRKLLWICEYWVPLRLRWLGVQEIPERWNGYLTSSKILEKLLDDVKIFLSKVKIAPRNLLQSRENIVFEGAQGLLLDQEHGFFPHVTRSYTGLKNAVALAQEAGIDELKTWYLTRSYLTRHGAGPMPHETQRPVYSKIQDATNIPNPYQGSLRFGLLNADLLRETIWRDMRYVPARMKFSYGLSVSCMDQIDDQAMYVARSETRRNTPDAFLDFLQRETEASSLIASYGPRRGNVREIKANRCATALAG